MNQLDYKIDILCSISYLNESAASLPNLSSASREEVRQANQKIEEAYRLDGYERMKMPLGSFAILSNYEHYDFVVHFLETVHFLSCWVKEKMYLAWEEDDVAFLNFMLHNRTLYEEDVLDAYSPLLRLLMKEALLPLLMETGPKDPFFGDMAYWFASKGKDYLSHLGLKEEGDALEKHFETEGKD